MSGYSSLLLFFLRNSHLRPSGNPFRFRRTPHHAVLHWALVPNPCFERPRPWRNQIRYFALTELLTYSSDHIDHSYSISGCLSLLNTRPTPHLNVMKPSQCFSFDQTRGHFHSR